MNKLQEGMRTAFEGGTNFYMPSFFKIKLSTSLNFEEIFGTDYEHIFFHEYLHYLEDILTSYGLANTSKVLNCIKYVYHHVKSKEAANDFILCRPVEFDSATKINCQLFGHYLQYQDETIELNDSIIVTNIETEEVQGGNYKGLNYKVKEYKVTLSNGSAYMLGAHAINECICHLLEKKVYNLTSKKIIPYDLALLVWQYYFKDNQKLRDNITALLDLMEFSLQFFNPAEIFIETLNRMTGKTEPKIVYSQDFYNLLMRIWNSSSNEKSLDIYNNSMKVLINDINGTLVSEIYDSYRKWLLQVLKDANEYRMNKNPVFSPLYNSLNKDNAKTFLHDTFTKLGVPPIFNDDGVIYIKDIMEEKKGICKPIPYISFFAAQGIIAVYEYLRSLNCGCNQDLKEACNHINESTNYTVYEIDEKCDSSPWEKNDLTKPCPFAAVWKTFGLSNMQVF